MCVIMVPACPRKGERNEGLAMERIIISSVFILTSVLYTVIGFFSALRVGRLRRAVVNIKQRQCGAQINTTIEYAKGKTTYSVRTCYLMIDSINYLPTRLLVGLTNACELGKQAATNTVTPTSFILLMIRLVRSREESSETHQDDAD